ncbi:UNVERIFIED_CONTAM: hypothetical protein K2H54_052480 [Gekko kuhli]
MRSSEKPIVPITMEGVVPMATAHWVDFGTNDFGTNDFGICASTLNGSQGGSNFLEDGWDEWWVRLEVWQVRMTRHLEEALMDIPQTVACVVQHDIHLQCHTLVPLAPAQVPPPVPVPAPLEDRPLNYCQPCHRP